MSKTMPYATDGVPGYTNASPSTVQTEDKEPPSAPSARSYDEWVSDVAAAYDFDLMRAIRARKDND